jgi:hypothetical protein
MVSIVSNDTLPMANASIYCISTSRPQADEIMSQLKMAGFFNSEISVLFPDLRAAGGIGEEPNPISADQSPGRRLAIRGTVGWLAGTATLAFPGGGPLIAAGPILAALIAASADPAGGLASGLIAVGIPQTEAARYDRRIRSGNILIATHTNTAVEVDVARDIFSYNEAQDIYVVDERHAISRKRTAPRTLALESTSAHD